MRHKIYSKDGQTVRAEAKSIEYNGTYMGERYLSVTVNSSFPIPFKPGDKITYRGEDFFLKTVPSAKRQARSYTSGDAVVYDSIRFDSVQSELEDVQFCDYVLNDNNTPYTGLGTFSFYIQSASDFGNRIQANLNRAYGEGVWTVAYGEGVSINKDKPMQVSSDTSVYNAIVQFSNDFDVNYVVQGRTITFGAALGEVGKNFVYGRGNGLKSLTRTTDTSQRVVTLLKAYGSTRNIPYQYYANVGKEYVVQAQQLLPPPTEHTMDVRVDLGLDFDADDGLFTTLIEEHTNEQEGWYSYKVRFRINGVTLWGLIECNDERSLRPRNEADIHFGPSYSDDATEDFDSVISYLETATLPIPVYIVSGVDTQGLPSSLTILPSGMPTNMSIRNLMLPGFPDESLHEWAQRISQEDTETGNAVKGLIEAGYTFSKDKYIPYIKSPKFAEYGLKDGEYIFDGSDEDWDEAYPSMKGMTVAELETVAGYAGSETYQDGGELDRLISSTDVKDNGVSANGVYNAGSKDTDGELMTTSVTIDIPNIGFNLWDYRADGETPAMYMNSGMCAGRSFEILQCVPISTGDISQGYRLTLQRELDQNVNMYYPNKTFGLKAGDEYVLEGIEMPDVYVQAAAVRLFFEAVEWLAENDHYKNTFEPEMDNIMLARNPQIAAELIEGMKMSFGDDEMGIPVQSTTISQLVIREGEQDIPQYEVTLDDEADAQLLSFETLSGGYAYTGGSGTDIKIIKTNDSTSPSDSNVFSALRSLSQFLRKDKEDSTRYLLSLFGGAVFGADGFAGGMSGFGARIDDGGNGELESLTVRRELIVPLLSYNRVDIKVGDKWRAPGGGVIASVDTSAKRCTLRLEEGEIGAVAVGDICMGIFHSEVSADNAAEDMDDGLGNRTFAGFTTVYFRITGVEGERNEAFTYELRPVSERWTGQAEPFAEMQFVAYGSFTDEERQTSVYETRTYTRMLWKQNTWEIGVENIALQYGDLSNLGVFGMQMDGYSAYLNSVYFTGTLTQVKPDGTPVRTANDRGAWEAGKYDYYDRVSHDGCIWLCVAEDGTESEPSKSSADWLLQVDKGADGTPGTPGEPGKDGTGIEVKGSVKAHFKNFAALVGGGTGAQDGDKFILDDSSDYSETSQGVTQKGYAAPSVMGYWNAPDFTWSVAKAAVGDCYTDEATGHMWVAEEKIWKDAGKVKGEDGQDGVNIGLVGSPLAINASEINADMTGTRTWTARVRVYQGAEQTAVTGITLDNSYNNVVTASVDGGEGVVTFTANSENWAVALLYAFAFSANDGIPFTVAYTDKGDTERTADGVVGVSLVQDGVDGKDVNANLLDDTDFISEARMSAWNSRDYISWQSGAEQTDDYAQSIQEGGPQGANYIHAGTRLTEEKITYKEILQQDVGARLTPGEWHTLSFRARSSGGTLATHVYPSCVDASAGCYVDGVKQATVSDDGYLSWNLPDTWELHTFTFKAKAEFTAEGQYVLFRQMPPSAGGELVTIDISRPKLETGQAATAYMPGNTDMQGMDGCAVRTSEWAEGVEYRNDEGLATDGVRYLDVAMVRNDAAETGWDAYECLKTHTSSASLTYTNAEYWRKFGANVGAIFTSLIIAKNAKIRFLQGNSITVEKEDGTVTAGMQGSAEGKKTRFWAGSSVPDDAPFRVDEYGKMTATDAEVNGIIHSRLTYSSVKRLMGASGYYTINPLQEAFNTLFITATADLFVTLPDADEYEGLELNIYQSVVTRTAMGTVVIKTAASLQEIYYSASTALINGVIVQTVNTEANHAESLVLTPNVAVKMVAVNGNWYVLTGVLTGE